MVAMDHSRLDSSCGRAMGTGHGGRPGAWAGQGCHAAGWNVHCHAPPARAAEQPQRPPPLARTCGLNCGSSGTVSRISSLISICGTRPRCAYLQKSRRAGWQGAGGAQHGGGSGPCHGWPPPPCPAHSRPPGCRKNEAAAHALDRLEMVCGLTRERHDRSASSSDISSGMRSSRACVACARGRWLIRLSWGRANHAVLLGCSRCTHVESALRSLPLSHSTPSAPHTHSPPHRA